MTTKLREAVEALKSGPFNLAHIRGVVDAAIADWTPKAAGPIPNGYAGTIAGALWLMCQMAVDKTIEEHPPSSAADLTALRWQPIETAPKDGTDILVLHPDRSVCISYWGCIRGVYGVKSKLHSSASGGEGDFCRDATHWMPLPEAPK